MGGWRTGAAVLAGNALWSRLCFDAALVTTDACLAVAAGPRCWIDIPEQAGLCLRAKGVPVAYLAFEGEQHGFRRSETVITVLGSELAFYGRVLGFTPAGDVPDLEIDNL